MSQIVSLAWDGHHITLMSVFKKLLESSYLVDCTIAAEGQKLKAHKEVLSAFSPYFELLFREETGNNPTVILSGINFKDLSYLIDFIYQGKLEISEDRFEDLIDVAQCLQIKGLCGVRKDGSGNTNNTSVLCERLTPSSGIPCKRKRNVEDEEVASVLSKEVNVKHNNYVNERSLPVQNVVDVPTALLVKKTSPFQKCIPNIEAQNKADVPSISAREMQVEHNKKGKSDCSGAASDSSESSLNPMAFLQLGSVSARQQMRDFDAVRGVSADAVAVKNSATDAAPTNVAKPFCPTCQRRFSSRAGLRKHLRSYPADIPLDCDVCGETFFSCNLKVHMTTHTVYKPYRCDVCNYGTTSISNLNQHQRIHIGFKPYKCTECNYTAVQSSNLNRHKRIHGVLKPYRCTVCDFATAQSRVLKRHQLIHSGEKSYKCKRCEFKTACKDSLKAHMQVHEDGD